MRALYELPHYFSLVNLVQDDGFGNMISTNCETDRFVMDYVEEDLH